MKYIEFVLILPFVIAGFIWQAIAIAFDAGCDLYVVTSKFGRDKEKK